MPNAPTNPPPQSLTISDFTPGIRQVASLNHPPGTADDSLGHGEQGTFGCWASPNDGVLRALPKRTNSIERSAGMVFTGANLAEQFRICGIFAMDPVFSSNAGNPTVPGPDQNNTDLWVAVEYWVVGNREKRVLRYSRHATTPAFTLISSDTSAGTYSATSRPSRCYFTTTRSWNADPSIPGVPILAWAMSGFSRYFPDDTAGQTILDTTRAVPNGGVFLPPDQIIGYQNRLVVFPLNVGNGGGLNTLHPDNELIYWSAVNDARNLDSALTSYSNVVAYPERDTGYEIQAVISNDQLLLIKRAGGGLVLQGDLNDFTSVIQPNLKSPGLALNQGTNSVIGYVYPSDAGGVWVVSGSMSSRNLSPFMEDNFWRPRDVAPANPQSLFDPYQDATGWGVDYTSCVQWQQWVLLPNNWLYDTDTQAWWRIDTCPELDYPFNEDPDTTSTADDLSGYLEAHWWAVDWTGRWAWSAPSGYNEFDARGDSCIVFNEYDRLQPANVYQWLSHPLPFSIDKTVEIQDIILTWENFDEAAMSIESKVTIEIIGVTQANVAHLHYQQTWCSEGDPGLHTHKSPVGYGVQGSSMRLFIRSQGGTEGITDRVVEAPRIHRIEIQYVERSETPRNVCDGGAQ